LLRNCKKGNITATLPHTLRIDVLLIRDDYNLSDSANPEIFLFITDPSTEKAPLRWSGKHIGAYLLVRPDRKRMLPWIMNTYKTTRSSYSNHGPQGKRLQQAYLRLASRTLYDGDWMIRVYCQN
jgi:hypothetical protein